MYTDQYIITCDTQGTSYCLEYSIDNNNPLPNTQSIMLLGAVLIALLIANTYVTIFKKN